MHSEVARIIVKNLVKTYRLFGHPGDRIKQALTLGRVKFHREFTSLHDVTLDIQAGEIVGIVGQNGSGKSTLLQLICGILKPTGGKVSTQGRIAALLELGAGFNPEFTGRENVFFQGAVMGYSRAEIEKRFPDIVDFADIGDFIDQPVRTYSSGMFIRLAFSAMVHTDADILVIDEALAVGDEAFQRKCFDKLSSFLEANNKILLIVSHNIRQIERICSKVVWLEKGRIRQVGDAVEVCAEYMNFILGYDQSIVNASKPKPNTVYTGELDINSVYVVDPGSGNPTDEVMTNDSIKVMLAIECHEAVNRAEIIVSIHTTDVVFLTTASTDVLDESPSFMPGLHHVECEFSDIHLLPGLYQFRIAVFDEFRRRIWVGNRICPFRVVFPEGSAERILDGVIATHFNWKFN